MWNLSCALTLLVLALGLVTAAWGETTLYVAPEQSGASDDNDGSREAPFRTLDRARQAVRDLVAAGLTDDVTVLFAGGVYELTEPLVFGPEEGGTAEHSVTWAAGGDAEVVFTGARPITQWQRAEGELWTAQLPADAGDWMPWLLVVDGSPAVRARTPNADADPAYWAVQGEELDAVTETFRLSFEAGRIGDWDPAAGLEFVCQGNWAINRKRVKGVEPGASALTMLPPHLDRSQLYWNWPGEGRWCFLEGLGEFLDQPGEWCLDQRTGVVTYWPREGEDMATARIVAPFLTRLVEVRGAPDRPVRNLHFRGITFEGCAWPLPPGDYHGIQACHFWEYGQQGGWKTVPCAILFEWARDCSLTRGAIVHTEGGGLEIGQGCTGVRFERNEVFDIGGNGLMVGGPNDEALSPKANIIADNIIHACGTRFYGAVGIWVGFASGNHIAHNELHDLPYSGISVGWVWDPIASACHGNVVESNHIYDVMKKLGDGGGIYTLGLQPGMIIRGNYIHHVHRSPYVQAAPNNGMFIDEGSTGFLFERNVIHSTSGEAVRFNRSSGDRHMWHDNYFDLILTEPGVRGIALRCAGNCVEVPHSDAFEPEQLTLSAWILLERYNQDGDTRRWIANKNTHEWTDGHYSLNIQMDRAGAYLNIGGGPENTFGAFSQPGLLHLNRWHHIAMAYDGAILRTYCDGHEVASQVVNRRRVPGTTSFVIGRRQDGYNSYFGLVDEVRLYNRALSPEEILAQYQADSAQPPQPYDPAADPGLVGHWGFEDLQGAGQTVQEIIAAAGPRP